MDAQLGTLLGLDLVDNRGRGVDEIEVVLPLQALLDDLHVKQTEVAAAETESERIRGLGLIRERRIVELELLQGRTKVLKFTVVDRVDAGEDHRLDVREARKGVLGGVIPMGDGVADLGICQALDGTDEVADLSSPEHLTVHHLWGEDPQAGDFVVRAGLHELDAILDPNLTLLDADEHNDTDVGIEPGVDNEGLQQPLAVPGRRLEVLDHSLQDILDADTALRRAEHRVVDVDPDDLLDLLQHPIRLCAGQIDLVDHRDDLKVLIDGEVDVGEGLGLDTLSGIDHQKDAFTGRQRPADFVGEVDMSGGVDEVEGVDLAVLRLPGDDDGLGLDGDPALSL